MLYEYILKYDIHENLLHLLRNATVTLCRDTSWIQSITLKQKFCLKCIAACCSRITPPGTSSALQWVQTYSDILTELGLTYNKYCHQNGLTDKNGHLTCPGQQQLHIDLLNGSIEDARRYVALQHIKQKINTLIHALANPYRYFEWVQEVQGTLKELNDRLVHQEITVHAIMNTKDEDDKYLECLSVIMCIPSLVSVKKMKRKCSSFLEEVNKVLLKTIPGEPHNKFIVLPELLSEYHVALPQNLQEMVSKYVIYPSEEKETSSQRDSKCSSHLQADCMAQQDNKPSVELSESVTMNELAILVNELDKFHELIEECIAMLTFFKFHSSALFQKCFNAQTFSPVKELQSHHIRDTKIPPQHKENEMNLSSFVLCLENTHKLILKFLNGQCHYADIVQLDPEAHLEIAREFEILQQYSAVFRFNSNGLTDTCNMFNFHKFTCQVNSIIFVCRQFRLEECLKDSRLCKLQKEVLKLQNETVRSKLTSTDISRKMKHMKELLCIGDDTNLQCLDLFSAVKAYCSDALVQVMTDEQCRLRHKDVAKHLQYEASAIKDFSSIVELMNPFLDADQKFESLMVQVFEKGNMEQGIEMLKIVDAQVSVINEVFSSEVSFSVIIVHARLHLINFFLQSPVLCREEKQSAIQAKEENMCLREKFAQYEYQLKQLAEEKTKMQERIDYLEKENNALLRKKKELHQETLDLRKYTSELTIENRALKEDNQSHKAEIQVLNEEKESLLQDSCSLQKEMDSLQQTLPLLQNENDQLCLAQQELITFGIEPWKVSRDKVKQGNPIGGGAWGAVYKGELEVAIKQFHPNILSPHNLDLLKREMKMLSRIRHPNLVQFIAVVFEENDDVRENPPYIITEVLDMSLRQAYENDHISERNMCPIFQDTARALDYLHRHHEPIIHRDVSSANILLKCLPNGMWMAKVSDLGSANFANVAITMNAGAIIYCAPEAFTDKSNTHSKEALTPKVDVYSYGIMLCEVVTRQLPKKEKFKALLKQTECKQPRLYPLILQCISQEPNKRPSMANVLTTLETLPL